LPDTAQSREGNTPVSQPIPEIDILWITAGLGCDGDTIAMTAATQPSIEDIVLGAMPWIPKVHLHNPFLAMANGDDFLKPFHLAAAGNLSPFILVVEGSIPNENNKQEGYWASLGTNQETGQPITTCEWIDRLAPRAWAVLAAGTCATYGGNPRDGRQSYGLHGPSRLSRVAVEVNGKYPDRVRPRVSGAAGQLHGNASLPSVHGLRSRPHDSAR